jgi:hypothetical protein
VVEVLAAGRAALPALAMGTDAESLVHVGMDRHGTVVRLDLDPQWRRTLPSDGLAGAVSDALQQAAQVRTGDWAAAIAAAVPSGSSTARHLGSSQQRVRGPQPPMAGPVRVRREGHAPVVTIAPGWAGTADDGAVHEALLAALVPTPPVRPRAPSARPGEVGDLALETRESLLEAATGLPGFMRGPIQDAVERVHDDVAQVLTLPLASEGLASGELGAYASRLHECLWLADRPAGLPEASEVWAAAAAGLTDGLATARRPSRPILARLRRRAPV